MKILIGPFEYEVEEVERLLSDDNLRLYGQIVYMPGDGSGGLIQLEKNMPDDRRFATLWHEVLHGICEVSAVELDERDIVILATQIADVIRRNPILSHTGN